MPQNTRRSSIIGVYQRGREETGETVRSGDPHEESEMAGMVLEEDIRKVENVIL